MALTAREVAGDARRAEIVQAALRLFAERGYKGASLAQIAQSVGITQQAVLYHFQTKEQLLVAALEDRDRQDRAWWAETSEAAHGSLDFLQLCQRLVAHNTQRAGYVRMFTVLSGDSVTEGHPAHAFFRARYDRLRELFAPALAAVYSRTGQSGPSVAVVLAVLDGLQLQWLLDPETFDMAAEFDTFANWIAGSAAPSGGS
ncbi:TetR family transcriptional regulator [Jatrophihabitans sp. GAS493]|uniref:TetR/AcrR family transcriptional regulator n=1 Tax=Jatrophihabitans sp. GAS493 TaxID=1907575 RepID=UPI000BC08234|nr:TetR/AcrR family transcriptional regulator [Jatrophihabitans sp. GAS493]SOD73635.1 TetR family transcriptional regulator [Jatrophihabitans sp. GAS493]